MDASEAPMLLTQICCDWRSIALSTPRLWSRLYIPLVYGVDQTETFNRDWECMMEAHTEELQRWLRLSGACPLSITIMPSAPHCFYQPQFDAIVQSSRRWQQLELGSFYNDLDAWKRIVSISPDDLCMLRELRIHSTTDLEKVENLWIKCGLFTAQGLRSISIANLHQTDAFLTGIPSNWRNLNHLFIYSPIYPGLVNQILGHCCNLVACLLMLWDYEEDHTTSFATFSSFCLPRLKFLSLHGDPTVCSQVFATSRRSRYRFSIAMVIFLRQSRHPA